MSWTLLKRIKIHFIIFFLLGLCYPPMFADWLNAIFYLALVTVVVQEVFYDPWKHCGGGFIFLWNRRCASRSYRWAYAPVKDSEQSVYKVDMRTKGVIDLETKILALILGALLMSVLIGWFL